MGDLFKSISGGLARFVFAWMMPSVVTLGLFSMFVFPFLTASWPFSVLSSVSSSSWLAKGLLFAFFVIFFTIVFAYASLPIYRLLEGYTLPMRVQQRMYLRQLRRWKSLKAQESWALRRGAANAGLIKEKLNYYPIRQQDVRATALGNALTAMESFGVTRYGLDSQSSWYELQAVVPETVRKQTEEGRAPVDFYVSSIAHFALLGPICVVCSMIYGQPGLFFLGSVIIGAIPLCYRMAVKNVKDWGGAVRALVNLGRRPLADALGLTMPKTLQEERYMWAAYVWAIEQLDVDSESYYDAYRFSPRPPDSQARPEALSDSQALPDS